MAATYRNFNGLYLSHSHDLVAPHSLEEIAQYLESTDEKVRISGSIHTFNDMSLTKGITMRTTNLRKILEIDEDRMTITAEAGIIIKEINAALKKRGLALPLEAAISLQSLAGVTCTGTHGSNVDSPSFSGIVEGVTIVLGDGRIWSLDRRDGDYFRAARCSLGCLGAIYSVTLSCEPLYAVEKKSLSMEWNLFHHRLSYYLRNWPITEVIINLDGAKIGDNLAILKLQCSVQLYRKIAWRKGDKPGYEEISSIAPPRYYIECELGLPLNLLAEAVSYTAQLYREYGSEYPSLLIRFCGADDTLISMEAGRETIFLSCTYSDEVSPEHGTELLKRWSEDMIARGFPARPHFGKIHNLDASKMKRLYGKRYERFREIKEEMDPEGRFSNDYINRLF